jgi:hypothetical protein
MKFNGILEEITRCYPNINLIEFLQQKLELPVYKAEELASRLEKGFLNKAAKNPKQFFHKSISDKTISSELFSEAEIYPIDSLSDEEFELLIKWIFEEQDYTIEESHMIFSGFDFIALRDNEKIAICAMKFSMPTILSNSLVLRLQEQMEKRGCKKGILLATTYFSQQAIFDVQKLGIDLYGIDLLSKQISSIIEKSNSEMQGGFPQFRGSLLESICSLEDTEQFIIEPKTGSKYDLHLQGVKFPLLTFQVESDIIIRCILRIKNNNPVGENEGFALIDMKEGFDRLVLNDMQIYDAIVKYLKQFLE